MPDVRLSPIGTVCQPVPDVDDTFLVFATAPIVQQPPTLATSATDSAELSAVIPATGFTGAGAVQLLAECPFCWHL